MYRISLRRDKPFLIRLRGASCSCHGGWVFAGLAFEAVGDLVGFAIGWHSVALHSAKDDT